MVVPLNSGIGQWMRLFSFNECQVHGGTTANDIMHCLTRAEIVEKFNRESHHVDTILYIDEANTSDAFDLIKEIICDGRARSHHLALAEGSLKIIVSCNPYRRYVMCERKAQTRTVACCTRVRIQINANCRNQINLDSHKTVSLAADLWLENLTFWNHFSK